MVSSSPDTVADTPATVSGAVTVTVELSGVKAHCRVKLRFSCGVWNVTSASICAVWIRLYWAWISAAAPLFLPQPPHRSSRHSGRISMRFM